MSIAALFIIAPNRKELTQPSTGEWLHCGTYQGTESNRNDKLLIHVTIWINLQGITLSEKTKLEWLHVQFPLYNIPEMTEL